MKKDYALPAGLAKPAQRALANAGITSLKELTSFTEKRVSELHGIGPNALVKLKEAMAENGLSFAKK